MRIVATKVLRDFWERHPGARQHLEAWVDEVRRADWRQPAEIKAQFRSASILKNRTVVFNIGGNAYRLIGAVAYRYGALYIKFIGTHAEYDAVDAETVETELVLGRQSLNCLITKSVIICPQDRSRRPHCVDRA